MTRWALHYPTFTTRWALHYPTFTTRWALHYPTFTNRWALHYPTLSFGDRSQIVVRAWLVFQWATPWLFRFWSEEGHFIMVGTHGTGKNHMVGT